MKHGYRREWLGTERLWWDDAFTILTEQPSATSAVYRARHPDEFDHTKEVDRLETIAVLLVRGHMLLGKQADIDDESLPSTWAELWAEQPREEKTPLLTFDEIDKRMGW